MGTLLLDTVTKVMGSACSSPSEEPITIGYHKIRGLAGPLRMMCYYKGQPFVNEAYGDNLQEEWFDKRKKELIQQNACINLPFIIDGSEVVTQSITCSVFLGRKLG